MERTAADEAALAHLNPVEPDFISQSGENVASDAARHAWFVAAADEMRAKGATHFRYSFDAEIADVPLALVEGWKAAPSNEGEPRWQLVAKD